MGVGSFYQNQMQQAQDAVTPPEGTAGVKPAPESGGMLFGGSPGGNVNPYQNYGAHSVAYPGQSPQDWLAMQRGESIYNTDRPSFNPTQFGYNPNQGGRGYTAWPGQGYGGMPGRFAGAYNPMGGFAGGGMSNYGFGSSPFGYGGFSPWGYGPGSYNPMGAGSMGYGGGMGMMGGPMRPFTGFNYNNLATQLAGGPFPQGGFDPGFNFEWASGPDYGAMIRDLQSQIARMNRTNRFDRGGGGRGEGPGLTGGPGIGGIGTGEADSSGGNVGGTGAHGGCFAKTAQFEMADGSFKAIGDIEVGDMMRGGEVYEIKSGKSDRLWYDYLGTELTDEHFVLEDGEWKYVKDSDHAILIDGYDRFYTLNNSEHRLYGVNGAVFSDDAVFDKDCAAEKAEWDDMLEVLNGRSSEAA